MKFIDTLTPLPITVIYHGPGCADGHTAAWAVRKYLTKLNLHTDIIYYPAQHGNDPPNVSDREVIIVDFAYKRDVLLKMEKEAASIIVLDHHKTAEKDLEGLDFCYFDMNRSGAGLAWDYFFPDTQRPWLINYVEDRDIWNWKLNRSHEVCASLDSYSQTFEVWDLLETQYVDVMADEGISILRYENRVVETMMKAAYEVELLGHKVLAINSTSCKDQLGSRLAEGRPFSVVWRYKDGKYLYSLRSTDAGIDVSAIARQIDTSGGGHRNASGVSSITPLF